MPFQLQAVIALLVVASPLLLSVRYLWSDRQFLYRYEDVPPHVRRIAELGYDGVELAIRDPAMLVPASGFSQ